jgi:molecular chaperone GrpE
VEEKDRRGAGVHNQENSETSEDRVYDIDSDSSQPVGDDGEAAEPRAEAEESGDGKDRPRFSRKQILDRFAEKNSAIGKLQKEKSALEKERQNLHAERERWSAEKSGIEAQVKEFKDKWLRSAAEFENYRKRTAKEWELLKQQSRTEVILEVLNSLDDFERAFAVVEPGNEDEFVKGVRLIYNNLLQVLQKMGVVEIEAHHQPFDPNRHMAIGQIETDAVPQGHVAQVVTKGYSYNGSVIRPAHVIVAK